MTVARSKAQVSASRLPLEAEGLEGPSHRRFSFGQFTRERLVEELACWE